MSDSAYYWAVIGRILFDDEDTVFVTDLPTTQSEARDQLHAHMQEEDPNRYRAHGVLITALLRSTEPIELLS
jgi:hypothetical protein